MKTQSCRFDAFVPWARGGRKALRRRRSRATRRGNGSLGGRKRAPLSRLPGLAAAQVHRMVPVPVTASPLRTKDDYAACRVDTRAVCHQSTLILPARENARACTLASARGYEKREVSRTIPGLFSEADNSESMFCGAVHPGAERGMKNASGRRGNLESVRSRDLRGLQRRSTGSLLSRSTISNTRLHSSRGDEWRQWNHRATTLLVVAPDLVAK